MNRMNCIDISIVSTLQRLPQAVAVVNGSDDYSGIHGLVKFYQTRCGTVVYADINGLPTDDNRCGQNIFGFHIHSGTSCTGSSDNPFADAGTHYNPNRCRHPSHAGDLPPLFGCGGKAVSVFLTNRFVVNDVLERTVIIHDRSDDFNTQPGGNAGNKIACGVIRSIARQ